ncbi:MAG TPA: undecaprenyldiphospho-muramoylpentapeptide beta-N-acetylglucosaminyltransferase [Candidatus Eisenbacteria bacterium]|nr:undecaprenyldiphospho-muramoylpentapeptide beta-N-acetylglucosaminyltransferase [Candidatus Eisenbacteria bacterium]
MVDRVPPVRLLIAAGGTGGHVYPGIAVAEEWRRRHPDSEVVFVGTSRGVENSAVPQAGFTLKTIAARGIPRQLGFGLVRAIVAAVKSVAQAASLLRELRPHVVVVTGGYVSGPIGLVAKLRGIPVVVQEQNSVPGATNRWLNLIADEVHISFVESRNYFRRRNNLKVTGNPIRRSLLRQDRTSAYEFLRLDPRRSTLLVFGGSRGAASINRAFQDALPRLNRLQNVQIIWQTGRDDAPAMRERAKRATIPVHVVPYLDQMEKAYAVADLAVCRAGAMTIAELTACGVPAILVPYPFATHDHQTVNARGLMERGAAEVIQDKDLNGDDLAQRIITLFQDESRLRRMARNARAFSRTNAAERLVASIEALAGAERTV